MIPSHRALLVKMPDRGDRLAKIIATHQGIAELTGGQRWIIAGSKGSGRTRVAR